MKISALTLLSIFVATLAEGDEGHEEHGHKCACEAEEFGFKINCTDTDTLLASMQFLQANGCAVDCSEETARDCFVNWLIVQSAHDYCPEDGLPAELEDGFHDFDEVCESCDIARQDIPGAEDCPTANCEDNSGNQAYATLIADGCLSNCDEATCKENYFTLVSVHDSCDHDILSQEAEEGLHDLEEACGQFVCNSGVTDQLICDEEKHPEDECHCEGDDVHCDHEEDELNCSCLAGTLACADGPTTPPTSSAPAVVIGVASFIMGVAVLAL